MMAEYIKWFVEKILNEVFDEKELLSIWITQHNRYYSDKKMNYKLNHLFEQQMTIFDI